jgi:thiamine biosynthesis lipoprotein
VARRTEQLMGDHPFTIEVAGPADPGVVDAAFAELRWIDRTFSPFRPDSAVSRLNAGTLNEAAAEPLVREVLASCRRFERETGGYFSAWASGRLDPCGLVKGWAIARAAAILERAGYRAYFVDGAGDVLCRGERAPGRPWRVGIRHPRERERVVAVVEARDIAVATSGTYEKGAHIVDPHTGHAATDLVSLTVIGPDIVAADVYATAAFAMGRDGLAFIEGLAGYEAFAIDADLFSASTSGFEERLAA